MIRSFVPLALALLFSASSGSAGQTTDSFNVSITISSDCKITSTSDMDFGMPGVLAEAVTGQSTIGVTCTPGTPYTVGLNEGDGSGADTTTRYMTTGGAKVLYRLFRDAGRTLNWGNTIGSDTHGGTGSGSQQTVNVYGLVPAQDTPASGTYTDVIDVTLNF